MRVVHAIVPFYAACVAASCTSDRHAAVAAPTQQLRADRVSVWFDLQRRTGDTAVLELHLASPSVAVGAYQGAIRFEPSALQLISDERAEGDYTAVNPQQLTPGSIRFAGFSANGVHQAVIVRLLILPRRPLTSQDVSVQFDVLGSDDGRRLPASLLVMAPRPFTSR